MHVNGIHTQFLKAIGVGVALVRPDDLAIKFANPTFRDWFDVDAAQQRLDRIFDAIDLPSHIVRLETEGAVEFETQVKRKRRTLVIVAALRLVEHEGAKLIVVECQNVSRLRETEAMIDAYAAMTERKARELEREKTRVEKLLLNVMPRTVYEEYKTFGTVTPKLYEPVSVLMLDFVGFTEKAAKADPTTIVTELNDIFTAFDRIAEMHGCERIKTIGDAYLAVAGLPHPNPDHARSAAQCAMKMLRYLERRNQSHAQRWEARIGLATGPVVGSVVGIQKYVYDVFGPAVNRAARLQALSEPMAITVDGEMLAELAEEFHVSDAREEDLRGIGVLPVATIAERPRTPMLSAA